MHFLYTWFIMIHRLVDFTFRILHLRTLTTVSFKLQQYLFFEIIVKENLYYVDKISHSSSFDIRLNIFLMLKYYYITVSVSVVINIISLWNLLNYFWIKDKFKLKMKLRSKFQNRLKSIIMTYLHWSVVFIPKEVPKN